MSNFNKFTNLELSLRFGKYLHRCKRGRGFASFNELIIPIILNKMGNNQGGESEIVRKGFGKRKKVPQPNEA